MDTVVEKKPLDLFASLLLFLIVSVLGTALTWLYLGLMDVVPYIIVCIIIAVVYGGIMFGVVFWLKKTLRISNTVMAVIATLLAVIVINYFKWQIFFGVWYARVEGFDLSFFNLPYVIGELLYTIQYPYAHGLNPVGVFLNDFRLFLDFGTWGLSDSGNVRGVLLGIVWAGEFVIIFGLAIAGAIASVGILLPGTRQWAQPLYLVYNFETLESFQIERLAEYKEIDIILNQPLAGTNSEASTNEQGTVILSRYISGATTVSNIAHLHSGDTPTDYIMVSETKTSQVNIMQGQKTGKSSAPIYLGLEKIEELKQALRSKHLQEPVTAPKNDKVDEMATSDIDLQFTDTCPGEPTSD